MTSRAAHYSNPRMDYAGQPGNAVRGQVRADPVKIAWIGSMLLIGTVGAALTISLSAIALFIGSTAVTLCLGHSLGMHRRFIHRSFACPKWLEYGFVHLGVLVGLAGPLGMLLTHDIRDWAQRQPRCHDYFGHRQVWYRDLSWQLFCSIDLERPPELCLEARIAGDPVYRWMERSWMLQQLPWALLFFGLGGWSWVCWGIGTRVSVSVLGHWLIGYFAHNTGDRDWHVSDASVQGHNVPFCAILTMGESWHNNHHAFPCSAKLGLKKGQWDPGWWVLTALEKSGLAWNVRTADALPAYRSTSATETDASHHRPRHYRYSP